MLNFTRTTYVLTLFMACSLGLSAAMGWWLNCAVTAACLGRISWVAYRSWQAERRAAEVRAQEADVQIRQTLDMQMEVLALCRALVRHNTARSAEQRKGVMGSLHAEAGESLALFVRRSMEMATTENCTLLARHNGRSVYVLPEDDAERVTQAFQASIQG